MSDFLRLKCYECEAVMRTVVRQAGKRSRCPACGAPLRIPGEAVFQKYARKKVRAIREPEWDLKRVRAKREQAKRDLLREHRIESERLKEAERARQGAAHAPPPTAAPDVDESSYSTSGAGSSSTRRLPSVGGKRPSGPLPRRGEADPSLRKEVDPRRSTSGSGERSISLERSSSADRLGSVAERLQDVMARRAGHAANAPDARPLESADGLDTHEDESSEVHTGRAYNPSDLDLDVVSESASESADFHDLLEELANDEELDL